MSRLTLASILAGLCVLLAGCGHVPLSSMWALRKLDPVTADPALMRAAVRMPASLEPRPGGVVLQIEWHRPGGPEGAHFGEFVLEETTAAADTAQLAGERKPGTAVRVFRMRPDDVSLVRAMQAESAIARRETHDLSRGSLKVKADACRRADIPPGPILTTTWLRLDAGPDYIPVLVNVDLRDEVGKTGKSIDEYAPPCGKLAIRAAE